MVACFGIDGHEAHESPIARLRAGKRVYLTKRPGDLQAVQPRLSVDSHFHVICLMRDPRDVVVSRHGKARDKYWVPLRVWKQRLPVLRRLTRHARFTVIKYEDLVRHPDAVQRQLMDRLPFLRAVHPFSEFHGAAAPSAASLTALGSLRPFDEASIGGWHRHLPRVKGQLAQHGPIADELIEFGYEKNADWLRELDDVVPDLSPSVLADERRRTWRGRLRHSRVVLPWISARIVLAARAAGVTLG
jgi:hypothetical protein